MKIRGPVSPDIINALKGIIDIYPHTVHGRTVFVARKWPRKPRDISGRFHITHQAARLTLQTYRQICKSCLRYYLKIFKPYHQYPLDYWRAANQSWAYHHQSLPAITCVEVLKFDKEKRLWTIKVKHSTNAKVKIGYRPAEKPEYPQIQTKKYTRRGPKSCTIMPITIPQNTLDPVQAGATESMFVIPDRALAVPYIDTAPTETHTLTIQSRDTKDASLYNYAPNYNTGNLGSLSFYYYAPWNREVRVIIAFPLPPLPTGAEITSATIRLWYNSGNTDIYNPTWGIIVEEWEEMEVTWNNRKSGTPWSTPGGTFRDPQFCPYTFDGAVYTFDATALIKSYYADYNNSHGLILIPDHSQFTNMSFRSSEHSVESTIPEISITYRTGGELPENTPRFFPILFWYPDHPKF